MVIIVGVYYGGIVLGFVVGCGVFFLFVICGVDCLLCKVFSVEIWDDVCGGV